MVEATKRRSGGGTAGDVNKIYYQQGRPSRVGMRMTGKVM
jgi:hypothetical protein